MKKLSVSHRQLSVFYIVALSPDVWQTDAVICLVWVVVLVWRRIWSTSIEMNSEFVGRLVKYVSS